MKINELRIGNFVSTNGKPMSTSRKGIYKVLAIDSRDSFEELKGVVTISCDDPRYKDVGAWYQCLEPIPLTPELLEKCGFELMPRITEYYKKYPNEYTFELYVKDDLIRIYYTFDNGKIISNGIDFISDDPSCGHHEDAPIYLHQLQNMYYAITQKELEVKL